MTDEQPATKATIVFDIYTDELDGVAAEEVAKNVSETIGHIRELSVDTVTVAGVNVHQDGDG